MKKIALLTFLILSLSARDNPFQEVFGEKDIDMREAPNLQKPTYFTTETITLPTSARVVEEIVIKYKNVDGTVLNKNIKVNKDIDWHYPLVMTHTKTKIEYEAENNVTAKIVTIVPPPINDNLTLANEKIQTLKPFNFLTIDVFKNTILIETKDLKLRDFVTTNPDKIVLDLDRNIIKSMNNELIGGSFFKEVQIGKHDDYYRIALTLDGKYSHTIKKVSNGYLIEVK